jgi:hypothetical protein
MPELPGYAACSDPENGLAGSSFREEPNQPTPRGNLQALPQLPARLCCPPNSNLVSELVSSKKGRLRHREVQTTRQPLGQVVPDCLGCAAR